MSDIEAAGLQAEQLKKLREPFAVDWISKLPKPTRRENQKGNCQECGKYHGLPAVHIDYVGHADVTERLLDTDLRWNWEPFAVDEFGTPRIKMSANGKTASMWIRLTVCGVTRPGVGTAPADKEEVLKELVSDAIRNASMRFGVALDLWSKADRTEASLEPQEPPQPQTVSLVDYIKAELNANERDMLRVEWKRTFDFSTSAVPKSLEQKCRAVVDSFAGQMPDLDKPEPASLGVEVVDLSGLAAELSQAQRVQLKAGWSYEFEITAVPKESELDIRDLIHFIQSGGAS